MNCNVPHILWRASSGEKRVFNDRDLLNEDRFNFDGNVTCPRISCLDNGVLHNNTEESWPVLIDLDEHITLPTPIMPPNVSVKCGTGPVLQNASKKNELNYFLFKETLAHECRHLIRNSSGTVNLSTLRNDWKKLMKRNELPENESSLITVMDRYGCDEPLIESYAGGNLAILQLQDNRYLIHSAMETFYCQLCLTRMTVDDKKNPLGPVSTKIPLDGGIVYQIAVPHQFHQSNIEYDSFFGQENDPIFATRQFHTTRLWKVEQYETGSQPIFTNIEEFNDTSSTVCYVALNQFIWGEYCELRPQGVKISQGGVLRNEETFLKKYDCVVYREPKTLIFSSSRTIDLLDTRCKNIKNLQPVFSIEDKDLHTFYNLSFDEKICSFSASSREDIYLIATEKSLLVWDIRFGKRPVCRTTHLLDSPPDWISTIGIDHGKDWIFLDSQNPASSVMVGLSSKNQDNCLDGLNELPIISVEIEPRVRWNIQNTFDVAHQRGIGLDWSIQNRYNQMRSGIACDKDIDGTIQIWQCTVAGDIFSQQLNPTKRIGPSNQKTSDPFFAKLNDWVEAVEQIEELNSSLSPNLHDCTEEFDVYGEKLNDEVMAIHEEMEEENFGSFHIPAMCNYKYASQSETDGINCQDSTHTHSTCDRTHDTDGRSEIFIKQWVTEDIPGPSQNFLPEETFSFDFGDDLISSTPFQPMHKEKAVPLPGFLMSSTPAIRGLKPIGFSSPSHPISTPFRQQNPQTWNTPSQRKTIDRPESWDF